MSKESPDYLKVPAEYFKMDGHEPQITIVNPTVAPDDMEFDIEFETENGPIVFRLHSSAIERLRMVLDGEIAKRGWI